MIIFDYTTANELKMLLNLTKNHQEYNFLSLKKGLCIKKISSVFGLNEEMRHFF